MNDTRKQNDEGESARDKEGVPQRDVPDPRNDEAAAAPPPMQTEFDDPVDEASADSFPASDPPPWTLGAD